MIYLEMMGLGAFKTLKSIFDLKKKPAPNIDIKKMKKKFKLKKFNIYLIKHILIITR